MTRGATTDEHARRFTELRPLLFTIAYEILGSATDADDVLQDSYLRWADVDLGVVGDSKSYLAKVVTRQALNALRASSRRREDYLGPWLPEPILLDEHDVSHDLELAESVSTAMLVVLESLGPEERAVFVLREVFGFSHAEIGGMIGKSSAAVRQIAHRAREHVHARRPRFVDADGARAAEVTEAFLTVAATGDTDTLLAMLAPDVVYTADSDGKASAARRPVRGPVAVARLFTGLMKQGMRRDMNVERTVINGMPGIEFTATDDPGGVVWFHVVDSTIVSIFAMRNPDKLTAVRLPRRIAR